MKIKKVIIAVSLDEVTQKPFHYLKGIPIPLDAEIQLVHMVAETIYATGMQFSVLTYPAPEYRSKIEEEVTKNLLRLKSEIFPEHSRVVTKTLFDSNIKTAFTDYTEKERADLVVIATRNRHGIKALFDSSFAQHQLRYSPSNVLVLR